MSAKEKSDCLRLCRDGRNTELGRGFRRLLALAAEERLQALAAAEVGQVPRLQGAVLALREIVRELERDPASPERPDGAYS